MASSDPNDEQVAGIKIFDLSRTADSLICLLNGAALAISAQTQPNLPLSIGVGIGEIDSVPG
jgi:hypothetical protein